MVHKVVRLQACPAMMSKPATDTSRVESSVCSCVGRHRLSLVSNGFSVMPGFGPAAEVPSTRLRTGLLFRQKDPKPLLPGRDPVGVPSSQAKSKWRTTRGACPEASRRAQTGLPKSRFWPKTQPRPRQGFIPKRSFLPVVIGNPFVSSHFLIIIKRSFGLGFLRGFEESGSQRTEL